MNRKPLFKLVPVLLLISSLMACVPSSLNLREGIQSFKAQDFRAAFIRLKPEAEKGNPDAQYAVGYMYYYGNGVVEDRKSAWFWINKAASAGQPDAITAVKILEKGSVEKRQIFQSKELQHYPVNPPMY